MAHGLELDKDGKAKMAFSNREIPWHRLGVSMQGLQTAEAMLTAAQADFDVVTTKIAAVDDAGAFILNSDNAPVIIEGARATVRVNPNDGTFDGLAVVGSRYNVVQNAECLNYALDIVGASKGDTVVDTCGVLDEGAEFFACLDLGSLVIDPNGIDDVIDRYLLVRNSHNGKIPVTFAFTNIRVVCRNTVIAGMKQSKRIFTARHTRNLENALENAQHVLEISTAWSESFTKTAEKMLSIKVPANSKQFTTLLDNVFPAEKSATVRQTGNRDKVLSLVRGIYGNQNNGAAYGFNGWSSYNSIVEYLDHYRDAPPDERALASMDSHSWVSQRKALAEDIILSFSQ